MNIPAIDTQLDIALRTYASTFGHVVPDEVIAMFSRRSWLLTGEIRQAIALQRPVRAWQERSKSAPLLSVLHHTAR